MDDLSIAPVICHIALAFAEQNEGRRVTTLWAICTISAVIYKDLSGLIVSSRHGNENLPNFVFVSARIGIEGIRPTVAE
jgi:hypothetical protein